MKFHSIEIDTWQIRQEDCFKYLHRKMSIISGGFWTGTKSGLLKSPPPHSLHSCIKLVIAPEYNSLYAAF
jgi:hypothetical protein